MAAIIYATLTWTFNGAQPASAAVENPGNITYNTPGALFHTT